MAAPATFSRSSKSGPFGPPLLTTPIDDIQWRKWLIDTVWGIVGAGTPYSNGPQGTFPQLQTGKARFTNENAFQELVNLNQGLYVNYNSGVNNIIYGYACNVTRNAGGTFTVGAQINTWLGSGATGGAFGVVSQVVTYPGSLAGISANESAACDFNGSTSLNKWGYNPVFKNRLDGATKAYAGLSSNLYNYWSSAMHITSQPRGSDGEFSGWNVGIQFTDQCLDQATPIVWNNSTAYSPGQVVSNGGQLWKCISANTNVVPTGLGANPWSLYSTTLTLNAVGIDFSPMGAVARARMASAIRLQATMYLHWEGSGQVGTMFDSAAGIMHLVDNGGALRLGVDVGTGVVTSSQATIPNGGGAAPTLGTIGGSGPTAAAQAGWLKIVNNGVTSFLPVWI